MNYIFKINGNEDKELSRMTDLFLYSYRNYDNKEHILEDYFHHLDKRIGNDIIFQHSSIINDDFLGTTNMFKLIVKNYLKEV